MEIYVSINGVLRNLIQKFDYHYLDYFLNRDEEGSAILIDDDGKEITEEEEKDDFEYGKEGTVTNNNIYNVYKFHSYEEFENFMYIEYPIEIFGHAGVSYPTAVSDLNKFIYENIDDNVTLVGVDEFGKAKPSTLFFLSKNGCMANNIKFINQEDIKEAWEKCDVWITDSQLIADAMPEGKKVIKFKTNFNELFTNPSEIDKLDDIKEIITK